MKLTVLLACFFMSTFALANCPTPSAPPQYRSENNNIEQYVWALDQAQAWLSSAEEPIDSFVESYHDTVKFHTGLDQKGLIRKQQAVFRNFLGDNHPSVLKMQAIWDGRAVSIVKASCLDQLLFSGQLQRVDVASSPTEFSAYVFKQGDRLRIYVAWRTLASFAGPQVAISNRQVRELIAQGWQYAFHLHNHPFAFYNTYGDIAGTITASDPDLNTYAYLFQTYPMSYARITNGIDSGIYQRSDVSYLQSL